MTNSQLLIGLFFIVVITGIAIKINRLQSDDTAICQLQNSHDVCFQTLNR